MKTTIQILLGAALFGLVALHSLLSWLLSSVVLLVVVIFQNDIRRARLNAKTSARFCKNWWSSSTPAPTRPKS